jgi:uncharacterized protein (DUF302 family)
MNVDIGVAVAPGAARAALGEGARVVGRHSRPVARTVHHGDYTGIADAYRALDDWLGEHGYRSAGPPTETYLAGPDSERDPARYRTEVSMPVIPSFTVSVRVEDAFRAVVQRTGNALRSAGFDVLSEVDAPEGLATLVVYHRELARDALDVDQQAAVLLPTAVAVHAEADAAVVEALDPGVLVRATGITELEPAAAELRKRLATALATLSSEARPWTA